MNDAPIRTGHKPEPDDSPIRDMTGTAAHAKLRAFWGVPVGGYRRTYRQAQQANDVYGNLTTAIMERNRARSIDLERKAREGWELHNGGKPIYEVAKTVQLSPKGLNRWWRKLGLKTRL